MGFSKWMTNVMEAIRICQLKSQERVQDIPIVVLKLECAWERIDKHGDSQPSSRECKAGVQQGLSPVGGLRPHLEPSCLASWW